MNPNLANLTTHSFTTTNSMDKNKFTPELISELKGFYVERVVDNMDTKDLVNYVMDDLDRYYEKQSDVDFLEDAQNLSLIHICRCRRYAVCSSRWSP